MCLLQASQERPGTQTLCAWCRKRHIVQSLSKSLMIDGRMGLSTVLPFVWGCADLPAGWQLKSSLLPHFFAPQCPVPQLVLPALVPTS